MLILFSSVAGGDIHYCNGDGGGGRKFVVHLPQEAAFTADHESIL